MMTRSWIVLASPDAWRPACLSAIGIVFGPEIRRELGIGHEETARRLAVELRSLGYHRQFVTLGLSGSDVLVASLRETVNGLARSRQTRLYDLEEHLPLAAEELVGDFVVGKHHVWGVAFARTPWLELIAALRQEGVRVLSVAPTVLWSAQHRYESLPRGERPSHLIWEYQGSINVLEFRDERPVSWSALSTRPGALWQHLSVLVLTSQSPPRIAAVGPSELLRQELNSIRGIVWKEIADDLLEVAAAAQAASIVNGQADPWVELLGAELGTSAWMHVAKPQLTLATVALAFFVTATLGVLHYRAAAFARAAHQDRLAQQEVFRQAMAGQNPPAGIRSRLESEAVRLEGLRGKTRELPSRITADELLEKFLAAVPQGVRWRLLELRIEQGRVQIEGEIGTHSDAEQIAAALKGSGWTPSLSRTQQLPDRGVALSLSAIRDDQDEHARETTSP